MKKTKKKPVTRKKVRFNNEKEGEVPFVPDYELLNRMKNKPTEAEISAIGLMLLSSLPPHASPNTSWGIHSKLESLKARL